MTVHYQRWVVRLIFFFEIFTMLPRGGSKRINSVAGPWTAVIHELHNCETEEEKLEAYHIVLRVNNRYNRTTKRQTFFGEVDYRQRFERDKYQVLVSFEKWDPVGGWKKNFFVLNLGEPCALLDGAGSGVWKAYQNRSTPRVPDHCPLPKGFVTLNDWDVKLDEFSAIPALQYGKFRLQMVFHEGPARVTRFCIRGVVTIRAKPY